MRCLEMVLCTPSSTACMTPASDGSGAWTRYVYTSIIRYSYSRDSLIERKHGYYCQYDEQGRLASVIEYRRGKKKYQWNLDWDSEKRRYYKRNTHLIILKLFPLSKNIPYGKNYRGT